MNIDVVRLREMMASEALQLIDVRSAGEFAAGHVPGAVNVPMDEVEARLDDLKGSAPVVLICQSGQRSEMTCELLRQHRPEVMFVEGGTTAWAAAGYPVVRTAKSRWSLERQVRLIVGVGGLLGFSLGYWVSPWFLIIPAFFAVGLTFAGLTDICGMTFILKLLPWNRPAAAPLKEQQA
jgi:rhodanese-related sulfurtransferase